MSNPALAAGGAALVSLPILIHLLNKRRFKTVDWAAMDFLLEADKKNNRRVRLENLLLLLLRCLAVLLIALLVGRPFLPAGVTGGLGETVPYDRIVLLDDSLSMGVQRDDRTAFEIARRELERFVEGLAANGDTEDSLTVILASQPQRRLPGLRSALVTEETKTEIIQRIRDLKLSDRPVRFDEALEAVEREMQGKGAKINKAVYVVSDMRDRDWTDARRAGHGDMLDALRRVAGKATGCYLLNAGSPEAANLTVTAVVPVNKALVAGVESEFDVFVRNEGRRDVDDVVVRFAAGDSPKQTGRIASIPAGKNGSVRFRYTFAAPLGEAANRRYQEPVSIRVEVDPGPRASIDQLPGDNVRYFAARVTAGIPVLVVDGDKSEDPFRSETFYLQRALKPLVERSGDKRSGIDLKVIEDDDLHAERLDDYQIVFLCNLYQVGEAERTKLETWVKQGGRLVVTLGDQVDEELFNRQMFREGAGLSPLRLDGIRGDETEQKWASFRIEQPNHQVLRLFQADDESLLQIVKVFRWWKCEVPKPAAAKAAKTTAPKTNPVSVPLTLVGAGDERFPAVAEKALGEGRVVLLTTSVDADWNDWPQPPGLNVPFFMELVGYLTRRAADDGAVAVGEQLRHEFDLNDYEPQAELLAAGGTKLTVHSTAVKDPDRKATRRLRRFDIAEVDRRGFYRLTMSRIDGRKERLLFAANVSPDEGRLKPADTQALLDGVSGDAVKLRDVEQMAGLGTEGAKGELWLWVLSALVAALFLEQILAWYFGTKR
ncbi:MAG: BatA domain-containing protein [Planctomycetaceae bacterium]